jgi:hypothetical protein
MPLTDATLNSLGTSLAALITHLAIHSADPGTTGTSPASSARQPVTWSVDADGDLTLTGTVNFTGGGVSLPATYVGGWSAITGGTFRGGWPITGDQTFNAAGNYSLTGLTINGTST